ncbi:molybdopterin synthase sulfur carrier subunit-like isoform X2 [Amphibalanus amphitrite]|uniref:molybdopterin synthase sulfur carrier subunit-like isoform X2 n=1 Tax=Amphibalanus amphitrite TaxID=1232801 RepID=UPI001C90DF87|nr:molybdopterin synthase sulfur carrier subunit-like isoform X2 [Amphibalanus amphitrite]
MHRYRAWVRGGWPSVGPGASSVEVGGPSREDSGAEYRPLEGMPAAADVTLLLFAKARELVGSPQVSVSVPTECSGAELRELLVQTYPQLATLQGTFILAVNQRYLEADESVTIRRGDEVAVIPPISGG